MEFKSFFEAKMPVGECFSFATKFATTILADGIVSDVKIVHGIVKTKWDKPYAHAWVEAQGRCYDWQMKMTGTHSMPIKDFYEHYNPTQVKKYKPGEAVGLMAKHGHHGPWMIVYHQTSLESAKKIKRYGFNLKKATQGIVWFTNDVEKLKNNTAGSQEHGAILKLSVNRESRQSCWLGRV